MSTLSITANHRPQSWVNLGVARVLAAISTVLDVYGEAQQQAREAEKRFPYASFE
jgi:hypothetical protein